MEPFRVEVPDDDLDDLRRRLARARWPSPAPEPGWEQGTDLGYLRELVGYWRDGYDWRAQERRLNRLDHFVTEIDGQRIHFVHARSRRPDALPLLLSARLAGVGRRVPRRDRAAHRPGADPADAFHVVAPSLPGYGFSGPTREPGWHPRRIAEAFTSLMAGSATTATARRAATGARSCRRTWPTSTPTTCAGLHLNFVTVPPPERRACRSSTAEEQAELDAAARVPGDRRRLPGDPGHEAADARATRSTTRRPGWPRGSSRSSAPGATATATSSASFTKDQLLTTSCSTGSRARRRRRHGSTTRCARPAGRRCPQAHVDVPTGVANYPGEITRAPRSWVEHRYNVTHWTDLPRGGHFAAMEVARPVRRRRPRVLPHRPPFRHAG